MIAETIPIGVGLYSQSYAARLLRIRLERVRRWVKGYTYRVRPTSEQLRRQTPVVYSDVPVVDGEIALSFLELMELRVVVGLLEFPDISLQKVRRAADAASEVLGTKHPFASRRIFTDGSEILATIEAGSSSGSDLVELTQARGLQIAAAKIMHPILKEIEYSDTTALAETWWPLTKQVPIVLDPRVMFGSPTVAGTRITTSVLARLAEHDPIADIADAYEIGPELVEEAVRFENALMAA